MNEQQVEPEAVSETTPTMEEPMTHDDDTYQGPLRFLPAPPDMATRRLLTEKLRGHASSGQWLPLGLTPELDRLRAAHLETRDRVVEAGRAVAVLEERHLAEDAEHEERLRQAQRDPQAPPVEDRRTPLEQREAEQAQAREHYWAAVWVLAERVDAVHSYFRAHEADELLAELRTRVAPAQEERRAAEERLAKARADEFLIYQLGMWVQKTTDGQFGAQPAPTPAPPPAQFSREMLDAALERPWHRQPEELPHSWQEQGDDDVEPLDAEDETGEVSEIIETEGATT